MHRRRPHLKLDATLDRSDSSDFLQTTAARVFVGSRARVVVVVTGRRRHELVVVLVVVPSFRLRTRFRRRRRTFAAFRRRRRTFAAFAIRLPLLLPRLGEAQSAVQRPVPVLLRPAQVVLRAPVHRLEQPVRDLAHAVARRQRGALRRRRRRVVARRVGLGVRGRARLRRDDDPHPEQVVHVLARAPVPQHLLHGAEQRLAPRLDRDARRAAHERHQPRVSRERLGDPAPRALERGVVRGAGAAQPLLQRAVRRREQRAQSEILQLGAQRPRVQRVRHRRVQLHGLQS